MVGLRWSAAMVAAFVALAPLAARAQFVMSFNQVGNNVVATGSGTIDTTDLTDFASYTGRALLASEGSIFSWALIGAIPSGPDYSGIAGPIGFTSDLDILTVATSSSGDAVGIVSGSNYGFSFLNLPNGYVSGAELSDTATWDGATFSSLGLLPGSYVWTWGSGADTGSFTLNVGSPVPEPGSLAIVGAGFAGLVVIRRRRRIA